MDGYRASKGVGDGSQEFGLGIHKAWPVIGALLALHVSSPYGKFKMQLTRHSTALRTYLSSVHAHLSCQRDATALVE